MNRRSKIAFSVIFLGILIPALTCIFSGDELAKHLVLSFGLLTIVILIRTFVLHKRHYKLSLILVIAFTAVTAVYKSNDYLIPTLSGDYIQSWNVYHYYLGSKYFDELGYFDIYRYTLANDEKAGNRLAFVPKFRDLHTYRVVDRQRGLHGIDENRFSEERRQSFVTDLYAILDFVREGVFRNMIRDRGYNPSPFGNFVYSTLSSLLPIDIQATRSLLCILDWLVLIPTFFLVAKTFGWINSLFLLNAFFLYFGIGNNHFGAFLRFDWFCAAVAAICFYKRQNYGLAGVLLAYATMTRIFPVFLLTGPALKLAYGFFKNRSLDRKLMGMFVAFTIACTAFTLIGSTNDRGLSSWVDFYEKITVHSENHLHGMRRIGLKHAFTYDLSDFGPTRERVATRDNFENQRYIYYFCAAAVLSLLLVVLMRRFRKKELIALGLYVVFIIGVVSRYYWVLWFALLLDEEDEDGNGRDWSLYIRDSVVIAVLPIHYLLEYLGYEPRFVYVVTNMYIGLSIVVYSAAVLASRKKATQVVEPELPPSRQM
jgi:hypothetical protein